MYRLFQSVSHSRYKRTKFTQEDLKLIFSSKKISFKSPWVNFVFIYTYHAPPPSFPQKKSLYLRYLPCPTAHLFILTKSHRLIFPFDVARRARVFNRKTRPKNFRGASRRVASRRVAARRGASRACFRSQNASKKKKKKWRPNNDWNQPHPYLPYPTASFQTFKRHAKWGQNGHFKIY